MTELESALMDIARQVWSDGEPDAGIVERATARFVTGAAVIEGALGDDDYLVGNAFSVADIVVGSVLGFARTGELTELPARRRRLRRPARGTSGTAAGRRRRAPGVGDPGVRCGSGPPRSGPWAGPTARSTGSAAAGCSAASPGCRC